MKFIFVVMVAMIASSIVIEFALPQAFKDRVGSAICWGMMGVTMTVLFAATAALIVITVAPLFGYTIG